MTVMHSKWDEGQLIFYDSTEPQRYVDAFGPDVVKFIDEFVQTPFSAANAPACYTTTLVNLSTVALEAGATGGNLLITTAGAENDGATVQALGEAFKLAAGKQCYFGTRIAISDATESDFLVGLFITNATPLTAVTDGVYFRKIDGTTTMNFVLEKDNGETATAYGSALVAATYYTLEWYFDGTNVDWWVNGVLQTRPVVTNLPDDEWLTPGIEFLTGAVAAITCRVDWIRAIQITA